MALNNEQKSDRLEEIFQTCECPSHKQRLEIAEELDLTLKQVSNWFSNKRRRVQDANKRQADAALRAENERILKEGKKMKETQINVSCESCREYSQILKQLQLENELLKEKIEKMSKLLSMYEGNQGVSLELKLGPPTSSSDGDLVVG